MVGDEKKQSRGHLCNLRKKKGGKIGDTGRGEHTWSFPTDFLKKGETRGKEKKNAFKDAHDQRGFRGIV